MQIFKTTDPAEAACFAGECLAEGHEGLDVFFHTSVFVQTGSVPSCDRAACARLGAPLWEAAHLGGTIVCFPGDLSLCLTTWGNRLPDFGDGCMEAVETLLRAKGVETARDNNDVLADGRKVASWARAAVVTGWVQTVAHFSVNVDLDMIRQICTKPMNKAPGVLSEYGIAAEEIYGEIERRAAL